MRRNVGRLVVLAGALSALQAVDCAPATPRGVVAAPCPVTRPTWDRKLSAGCAAADLELVLPFYEGLRFKPAAMALRGARSTHLALAYPGPLSMPLVAWRCADGAWTAIVPTDPIAAPASIVVRTEGDDVEARMECFGRCTFEELHSSGTWSDLASAVARSWHLVALHPPLASRYDRFRYFVRQWVASDGSPALRDDWRAPALEARMRELPPRTMSFAFGIDPNEVDLEGHYFWSPGALAEARALVAANRAVGQFRWLNLRTYKYAIPRLGIERPAPPQVRAAAKLYPDGVNDLSQYVFRALEMCLGAEAWQRSRLEEMKALVEVGFRVIALDEFPTSPKWGSEPCQATNHLHRPNDVADEWRVSLDLLRRLAAYAHEHGVLLASEEPSTMLFPFTSGYMDGTFNEPADMYEPWQGNPHTERIPLFSTMFGTQLTPYTRVGGAPRPPTPWLVQEKVPSPD